MYNSPLENLSLLESLQGAKRADELDIYIPYIASVLDEMSSDVVDKNELQQRLNEKFNIVTPMGAITSLLVRAKNQGLVFRDNKQFFIVKDKVNKLLSEVESKKREIEQSINLIVDEYLKYCKSEFNIEPTRESAEGSIYNFIRTNISIFSGNISQGELSESGKDSSNDYRVASFIKYVNQNLKSLIPEVTRIVKGTLLANYLTIVDKSSTKNKFDNITVYLDTPLIIGILGWDGDIRKKTLNEFIELLVSLRINIKIFEPTFRELNAIFNDWRTTLSNRRYQDFHEMTRQLMKSRGVTPAQISTEITLLENTLEKNNIYIDKNFRLDPKHCCDELRLDKFLKRVGFRKNIARAHDVQCISSVFNSRKGLEIKTLNDSFCIFVTTNTSLEYITRRFFKKEYSADSLPMVASENWISTLLWLKEPDRFSNFPFDILLTDAYSTLNADDVFWRNFLKRLEKLKKEGGITEDEFNLVRYNNSLFGMVKHQSTIAEEDLDDDDIYHIIDNLKNKHTEDKEQIIKDNEKIISDLVNTSEKTSEKINSLSKNISNIFGFINHLVFLLLFYLALKHTMPSLFTLLNEKNGISEISGTTLGWLAAAVILLVGFIGAAKSVNNWAKPKISRLIVSYFA
ncbi:hypothetical protein [Photobacterium leiognathi]|uniref:hypothetical protein n=1 Tax=Photobacterium leiognathi TaxID=553611 RepID=UPI0029820415|nr:hypothetical protein [Photobacterium leiognathi]